MRLLPTEDQRLLTRAVRDFLATECTAEQVRATWATGHLDRPRWKALAQLGLLGMTVPEVHGGLGGDERDLVGPLTEAGRAALPEPLDEVVAVAAPMLAEMGGPVARDWLPRIAAGDAIVVAVLPGDPYPARVPDSDLLVVAADAGIVVLPTREARWVPQPVVDEGRSTVRLEDLPDGPPVTCRDDPATITARAQQRRALAHAAQLVGAAERAIDLAVAHARQREQFGQPIGAFQAVKHHLADALVGVRFAQPLVERAAASVATGAADADAHVALAKATAAEAAEAAVEHALQVHGAIGYTWECDLHLWLKRAYALAAAGWTVETCWQRVEAHLFG